MQVLHMTHPGWWTKSYLFFYLKVPVAGYKKKCTDSWKKKSIYPATHYTIHSFCPCHQEMLSIVLLEKYFFLSFSRPLWYTSFRLVQLSRPSTSISHFTKIRTGLNTQPPVPQVLNSHTLRHSCSLTLLVCIFCLHE